MSTTEQIGSTPPEPSGLRLALTLGVAGLLSGLVLVTVYEMTLPLIEANKAEALRKAVFEVVPGATTMQRVEPAGEGWAPSDAKGGDGVYVAYGEGGAFTGYAVTNTGAGFQDTIQLIYGFDPARQQVVGMRILQSRETPGLGDKIFKDPNFTSNFLDLAVEPAITLVKGGRQAPNQVDGITGATISSRAVVKILGSSVTTHQARMTAEKAPPAPGGSP